MPGRMPSPRPEATTYPVSGTTMTLKLTSNPASASSREDVTTYLGNALRMAKDNDKSTLFEKVFRIEEPSIQFIFAMLPPVFWDSELTWGDVVSIVSSLLEYFKDSGAWVETEFEVEDKKRGLMGEGVVGKMPPAPEACPGAGSKPRRSFIACIDGRMAKLTEECTFSNNPLRTALELFGTDKKGKCLASNALNGAEEIILNKFPADLQNAHMTGLTGHYKLPQKLTVGTGENQQTFESGQNIFWRVRWDFDPVKGPHVNAQIGGKPSSKFAFQSDQSEFDQSDDNSSNWPRKTMWKIAKGLNKKVGYSWRSNAGKDGPGSPRGEAQAVEDLKD
ncbi:hypothetical protein JMJ35_000337 [Cladonia borealis]|uniref:Uncharacterized protein n=1 Tax=Cladonia borealis TaxID=184061 RepID=A0AA39V5Q2_9LECA|nr:hypothetical protein JMJ35_000337 [Cladonia borealis]